MIRCPHQEPEERTYSPNLLKEEREKMKIQIEVPDAKKGSIIKAFCGRYGYQKTVADDAGSQQKNPETEDQFFKRAMVDHIKRVVKTAQMDAAKKAARKKAQAVDKFNIVVK